MGNLENCILLDGDSNQITNNIVFTVTENSGDTAGNTTAQLEPMQFGLDSNGEANMLDPGVYKFRITPAVTGWSVSINNFTISGVQESNVYAAAIPPNTPDITQERVIISAAAIEWVNGVLGSNDLTVTMHEAIERVYMHNTVITNTEYSGPGGTIDPVNNQVEVTIKLKDDYAMPTSDLTINLDIDGDANDYDDIGGGVTISEGAVDFKFHIIPYLFDPGNSGVGITSFDSGNGTPTTGYYGSNYDYDDSRFEIAPSVTSTFQYEPGLTCCPMVASTALYSSGGGLYRIYSDYVSEYAESVATNSQANELFFGGCGTYGEYVRGQYGGNYEVIDDPDVLTGQGPSLALGAYPAGGDYGADPWVADYQLSSVNFGSGTGTLNMVEEDVNYNPMNELCRAIQFHNYNAVTNVSTNMFGNTIEASNLPESIKFKFRVAGNPYGNAADGDIINLEETRPLFVWVKYTTANNVDIVIPFARQRPAQDNDGDGEITGAGELAINDSPFLHSQEEVTEGDIAYQPLYEITEIENAGWGAAGAELELFLNPDFNFGLPPEGDGTGILEGSVMKVFVFFSAANENNPLVEGGLTGGQ